MVYTTNDGGASRVCKIRSEGDNAPPSIDPDPRRVRNILSIIWRDVPDSALVIIRELDGTLSYEKAIRTYSDPIDEENFANECMRKITNEWGDFFAYLARNGFPEVIPILKRYLAVELL